MQQAVSFEAELQEAKSLTDVTSFAAYLLLESGETLDHPWISQLLKVGDGELDPRKLLEVYLENPESLTLERPQESQAVLATRFPASLPARTRGGKEVQQGQSIASSVGNKCWKNSSKLQKLLKAFPSEESVLSR